ncbi:MAG: hypothetical protein ACRDMZ_04810, partial [Solirubrobacteraceae bacterium]
DRARVSGFGVDAVRSAANEAGIDERYVNHALVEHGLVGGRTAPAPVPSPLPKERPSRWAGAALGIGRELEIEGEIPARDLALIVNAIRDETGRLGKTTAITRELSWSTGGSGRRLEIAVIPDQGRTTIRVVRDVRRMALVTTLLSFAASAFAVGPVVAVAMHDALGAPEEIAVAVGFIAGLITFVRGGRGVFRKLRGRAGEQVRKLGDTLAARVRERID